MFRTTYLAPDPPSLTFDGGSITLFSRRFSLPLPLFSPPYLCVCVRNVMYLPHLLAFCVCVRKYFFRKTYLVPDPLSQFSFPDRSISSTRSVFMYGENIIPLILRNVVLLPLTCLGGGGVVEIFRSGASLTLLAASLKSPITRPTLLSCLFGVKGFPPFPTSIHFRTCWCVCVFAFCFKFFFDSRDDANYVLRFVRLNFETLVGCSLHQHNHLISLKND